MKKFLLTLVLILSFGTCSSIDAQTLNYKGWTVENANQWGSFYWSVTRTTNRDVNGKYWYYVYPSSNSLFNRKSDGYNYNKAITYVRNVNIYMDEYKLNKNGYRVYFNTVKINLSHFTCDYGVNNHYIAYFWSYRKYNKFRLTFDKATPYDNSYN